ncbi:MAG: transglutaminase family protein [Rivihabitans pingtungensis]
MPPHARMSLAQQLLIRALVARFWRTPYQAGLTCWGTGLHDRFMLSTFVQMDFEDAGRASAGYAFELAWFAPHFAFRFPRMGELNVRAHPSGAAPRAGAPACDGRGGHGRHHGALCGFVAGARRGQGQRAERQPLYITVNGQPLPLQPTGRVGEYVAGVRYRAWNSTLGAAPDRRRARAAGV